MEKFRNSVPSFFDGAALLHFQAALDRATERAPAIHWIWDDVHPTYSGHQILADGMGAHGARNVARAVAAGRVDALPRTA